MGDAFLDLADPDDDCFDQQQVELAIAQSLVTANTELQPRSRPRAAVTAEDDDLQQALRESMRMFEEEQGGAMAGRKRSSSEDDAEQGHQQQQQGHSAQQEGSAQQQPTGSGPLKRQRSLGAALGAEVGGELASTRPLPHTSAQTLGGARLTRLHGTVVTTALPLQPQQQALGVLPLLGVQRSASVTNAAVGLRPWPSRGILQPHAQQHQGLGLQQQHLDLGRSASAHDLQAAGLMGDADMSDELEGSRPSSPAGAARINQQGDTDDGDEEDLLDVQDSDSSMTSIAHESGLPHTRNTWGADLLQAAAAAQQAVPRLVGPAPSEHDPTEWRIHSRQYYVGQAIFWQPYRNQLSYPGRVLSVDGDGSPGHPVLYTAEVHGHHTLSYVEATSEQLQPQLRKGDFVWCKPAAVKAACWSHHGPLYAELYPPGRRHQPDREPVELCSSSPWMRGLVLRTQLWNHRNPIAELRICGTGGNDCCWFRNCQVELMREVGESSATAEARAAACARSAQQQQDDAAAAAVAALCGEQSLGQENEVDMAALELLFQQQQHQNQQQQQQQQGDELQELADGDGDARLLELAAAGAQDDMGLLAMLAMHQQLPPEAVLQQADGTGQAMLEGHAAAEAVAPAAQAVTAAAAVGAAAVPSAGQPLEASIAAGADPGPGVPSGMSHPVAALTGESELEAAAAASVVDQEGGADTTPAAVQQPQQQQQQEQQQALAEPAKPPPASHQGSRPAPPQQEQAAAAEGAVVEGTGESAEGLGVQEVVGDSCPMLSDDGPGGVEGDGPDISPKEPLSNQHSGVEDDISTRPRQEGFGET